MTHTKNTLSEMHRAQEMNNKRKGGFRPNPMLNMER
jgi:hypothetical protein